MEQPLFYEGTAEEIAEQIRTSNLIGKLRAILTLDESETNSSNGSAETLDKALALLLEEANRVEREAPVPHTDPHEVAFGAIMQEKYRKMGYKL
jgi:hypothetical protein